MNLLERMQMLNKLSDILPSLEDEQLSHLNKLVDLMTSPPKIHIEIDEYEGEWTEYFFNGESVASDHNSYANEFIRELGFQAKELEHGGVTLFSPILDALGIPYTSSIKNFADDSYEDEDEE